jgi:transcription termination factor Rho
VSDTDTMSTEQPAGEAVESAGAPAEVPTADQGSANGTSSRRRGGLTGMVLAELRQLASALNIPNIEGMRKGDLISAIKQAQGAGGSGAGESGSGQEQLPLSDDSAGSGDAPALGRTENGQVTARTSVTPTADAGNPTVEAAAPTTDEGTTAEPAASEGSTAERDATERGTTERGTTERGTTTAEAAETTAPTSDEATPTRGRRRRGASRPAGAPEPSSGGGDSSDGERQVTAESSTAEEAARAGSTEQRQDGQDTGDGRGEKATRGGSDTGDGRGGRQQDGNRQQDGRTQTASRDDEDEEGGGRRRGRRFRDRNRRGRDRRDGGGGASNGEPEVREDDVLLPVAGILDVLDNYAFVRTSGYLSGPNDVYVSLSMVRRYGLRRGDNVSGVVRQPREGEQQRQKFNPLVRVDTINGLDPEQAKNRPEFTKLTPLYPNERMRLETEPHKLTTRVIDLVMPVGKGQRALIVSPPKAGKTMVLQAIANGITTNHPECHLMVVLVDERPEEVTDMQRSVKGEVIASTFDRPPSDHTTVAELAIERAKRLVEMGHDVVVLLDSITRLGRAYNLAAPASGRILSGGVDSTALYPPKRFLGAARNIEDGGSLTIFATALVETGSTMDTVIFEEFKGTGNAELKLDRKIADKRVFPAVDVDASSTRKEELLLSPDELAVTVKLRRVLAALDSQQALDLLLTQLRKTRTNIEFLMQVQKNTPSVDD